MATTLSSSNSALFKSLDYMVWIQTSFLGDIILSTGAVALAKTSFPNAKQILVTTDVGKSALKDEDLFEDVLVFEKKAKGIFGPFKRLKTQLAHLPKESTVTMQVHRSFRSSLLSRMLGFFTITYRQSDLAFLAQCQVDRISSFHEAVRIALLLEPLGVRREDVVAVKPVLGNVSRKRPHASFRVGLAPGSVWGTKRWPKEKYADLAARLLESYGDCSIVLLGSAAEREQTDFIAAQIANERVENLAGKTSLADLKREIANLDLLVTNDSSPIHYASALNTPTLAIFGATVPALGFGPLADKSRIAQIALSCRPCSDHGPQVCPLGHFRCMLDLAVEDVLAKCTQLLNNAER